MDEKIIAAILPLRAHALFLLDDDDDNDDDDND